MSESKTDCILRKFTDELNWLKKESMIGKYAFDALMNKIEKIRKTVGNEKRF